jgi:hypothetical protein
VSATTGHQQGAQRALRRVSEPLISKTAQDISYKDISHLFLHFPSLNPFSLLSFLSLFQLLFFLISSFILAFLCHLFYSHSFPFLSSSHFPWDIFSHYSPRNWTHLAPIRLSISSFERGVEEWRNWEFVNLGHRRSPHSLSNKWCIGSPRSEYEKERESSGGIPVFHTSYNPSSPQR